MDSLEVIGESREGFMVEVVLPGPSRHWCFPQVENLATKREIGSGSSRLSKSLQRL